MLLDHDLGSSDNCIVLRTVQPHSVALFRAAAPFGLVRWSAMVKQRQTMYGRTQPARHCMESDLRPGTYDIQGQPDPARS